MSTPYSATPKGSLEISRRGEINRKIDKIKSLLGIPNPKISQEKVLFEVVKKLTGEDIDPNLPSILADGRPPSKLKVEREQQRRNKLNFAFDTLRDYIHKNGLTNNTKKLEKAQVLNFVIEILQKKNGISEDTEDEKENIKKEEEDVVLPEVRPTVQPQIPSASPLQLMSLFQSVNFGNGIVQPVVPMIPPILPLFNPFLPIINPLIWNPMALLATQITSTAAPKQEKSDN